MPRSTDLETKIKIKFKDKDLLKTALTHRSYLNEHRSYDLPHNERLEFLGDAVLEMVTTRYLYENFKDPEGELTNLRAALVNHKILASVGQDIDLDKHIMLSRGEAKDTGRARQAIIANAVEALIGAIYLDQGMKKAEKFIKDFILVKLPAIMKNQDHLDPKSHLQEIVQDKINITPNYNVISETGPDHDKVFIIAVEVDEHEIGRGEGSSKRDAEVAAAENALADKDLMKKVLDIRNKK